MDRQTQLQNITEVVNERYGMIDNIYYELPEKEHDLLEDLGFACEEFDLTQTEEEIIDCYWEHLVTPILSQIVNDDSVIFNHFIPHNNHTIILCFVGIYKVDTLGLRMDVDKNIDDEIKKAIDRINFFQMQPTM